MEAALESREDAEEQLTFESLPPLTQRALEVELRLLSIILDTRALPVWLRMTTIRQEDEVPKQDETETKSEEWIEQSLVLAQLELDDREEWLRGLLVSESTF